MSTRASPPSSEFAWLSPAFRPTAQEIETYARLIAAAEGEHQEAAASRRHEAELQLWIWRNETRQRTLRRRRMMMTASAAT